MMVCFSCFRSSKPLKELTQSLDSTPSQRHVSPVPKASLLLSALSQNNVAALAPQPKEYTKQEDNTTGLRKEEVLEKSFHRNITEPITNLEEKQSHSANKDVCNKEPKQGKKFEETSRSSTGPLVPSISCYPLNNSYQYFIDSSEEHKDGNDAFNGVRYVNGKKIQDSLIEEESSESLFSLCIDSRKQEHASAADNVENEVDSPIPFLKNPSSIFVSGKETDEETDSSQHECNALNPIENITQWKAVKATKNISQSSKLEAKENIGVVHILPAGMDTEDNFKIFTPISERICNGLKQAEAVIGVDTSLCSWLAESEATPKSKGSTDSVGNSQLNLNKSTRSSEGRPTLVTLNIEEPRQYSASRSRTRSRSGSMPILGTVGNYWSCTGQSLDSDPVALSGHRQIQKAEADWQTSMKSSQFGVR